MGRYHLRYHRAISVGGRVIFPAGTILDSLDTVPGNYHDRFHYVADESDEKKPKAVEPELPELPRETVEED